MEPVRAQYWPGLQGVQREARSASEYVPAGQGVHCDWPLEAEKYPEGQAWGDTEFDTHEVPTGQMVHAVIPIWLWY